MPRFYFLGDDDLLEILGQAKNPRVIQSHLKKLFQGVHKVGFSEDGTRIVSMHSLEGEDVPLVTPVRITELVEEWLGDFAAQMKETLAKTLVEVVRAPEPGFDFPSQLLCIAEQVKFTSKCERAIRDGKLPALRADLAAMLEQYSSFMTQFAVGDDGGAGVLQSLKVKALVLDLVHSMDVVDQLLAADCGDAAQWIWQKQLRYYIEGGKCVVRMSSAQFDYSYEYQGNASKLVHTPLTDKCYLTLTQGMDMGFGGCPYGPAGTGKTESVKALGGCLGRQVLVFNCDEGIDFKSMGRIFIGLIKCGAWGCFDEFNRLLPDQLSAISQQIQIIQDAIKEKKEAIFLLGRNVEVDFNSGIFVTMNPAGKGYGGRSKLPDNLKALFRPVAMSRPDNNLIAEVMLHSEGFSAAKDLASKIVSLFMLSKELLSPQQHYDWGLRALKAVLNTGGKMIQNAKRSGGKLTPDAELELLIKAVRINTLSKLTFIDAERFLALISDVFPGAESSDVEGGALEVAIREVMVAPPFSLIADDTQVRKMLQLKESLDQRMGCVIVGPSGCGKSTVWRVLAAALQKCGETVKTHVMNPKSMPRAQLLGHMDLDTREWFDGVLTDAARKVVKEPLETSSWIVCDGDVDPEWIESLNSVLDDNHLLTLPNGERINFGSNVNFIFETHDLRFASPATISRMGMIFLSDEDVDVARLITCWILERPEERRADMKAWVDELFHKALRRALSEEFVVETTMVGTVMNGLSHIAGAASRGEFVLGLCRGLGGNLLPSARTQFAKDVFNMASERPPDMGAPLDCTCVRGGAFVAYETRKVAIRGGGGGGGAADDDESRGNFDDDEELGRKDLENGFVIPTVSVQRVLDAVGPWVENSEPFILVGPEGAGKNMIIRHIFGQQRSCSVTTLHCNAQTTAEHVISKIAQSCSLFSTTAGRAYRPRDAERLVLYLKDINLPKPDKYNTCMLIAFLQQLITFQGFYDQNLEFLSVERVQIVCSMNPATTVGRHPLSTRFTAITRVAYMGYPEQAELKVVYSTFLTAFSNSVPGIEARWRTEQALEQLSGTMVELFEGVTAKYSVDDHRHYLFTPRDLTQWVLGLLRYDLGDGGGGGGGEGKEGGGGGGGEELLDVFAYEAQRLFRDRLVDVDSEQRFDSMLLGLLRQHWGHTPALDGVFFSSLDAGRGDASGAAGGGRPLLRISADDFKATVARELEVYEREQRELNMLLFPQILDQLSRCDRALSAHGGSLLLVGRNGVGRRNAAALVAHIHGAQTFTLNTGHEFSLKQFHAELKAVLAVAGVLGEHALLVIEDHNINADSAVLETVNSLLSSGEVPGLYTHEELEQLLAPLRELMLDEGAGLFRNTTEFFVHRIQRYLHVALVMDPTHPAFLVNCESNPALYTRCTTLWLGDWLRESLEQVPRLMLRRDTELLEGEDAQRLVDACIQIHETCKARGATPAEFRGFLQNWRALNARLGGTLTGSLGHLKGGLGKLEDAALTVDDLSKNAAQKKAELAEAQVAADEAMVAIKAALETASNRRKETGELKIATEKAEKETTEQKGEVESELQEITPVLESAKKAVGMIKSDNINEIRSLKMPPEPIHDVLSGVLLLLGISDTSWLSMKRFLGNRGVKDDILNFDGTRIDPGTRKAVAKLLKEKGGSFDHNTIYRVSVAAAPLAAWVKANVRYSMVLEKIQPLTAQLKNAERSLEQFQERLTQCEEELAEIDKRVAALEQEFRDRTDEAATCRAQLGLTQETLTKAQSLLEKLSGERTRWSETVRTIEQQTLGLPIQTLMAAGFATYLGKTPEDTRVEALREWSQLCDLDRGDFDFRRLMSTESQMLQWKADGLPADAVSMENAIVITSSARPLFIIDPANAATEWLQKQLALDESRPLAVLPSQDPRFTNQVEQAVRFGKTLLVLDVDGVEPMLVPLVRGDLMVQGPRRVVQVGEKAIDFNENFRMFLVTRNPEPDLPPDTAALVTEVNFTVTRAGLEGQLLGVTIQHEQPELEQQKSALLKQEEDYKVQLAALETQLLEELATAQGNILDNLKLIESLTQTKITSAEIQVALRKSEEAGAELDRQRDVYRPFARDGSTLFFLIAHLKAINHMYQFSLAAFLGMFRATLGEGMEAASVEERIRRLTPMFERRMLFFVGRSLFKDSRSMWGMHLVQGMHPELFQEGEWDFFLGKSMGGSGKEGSGAAAAAAAAAGGGGGEGAAKGSSSVRGFPTWASPDRAEAFRSLLEMFPSFVRGLSLDDAAMWGRWARDPECEVSFPKELDRACATGFQRVMLIQVLRPDRLMSAINKFVCSTLSVDSISPPPVSFAALHAGETSADVPILMITTAGADPSRELEDFAGATVGKSSYKELAMGGGQQEVAMKLLKECAQKGHWLCLKNLHLVVGWLLVLEKAVLSLAPHADFRLWLTTEEQDAFPLVLLQSSLKLTFESPPGLKKNLQRTYSQWPAKLIESGSALRAKMLFTLAWFHGLVQERRTYMPQGWTEFYEFSFGDLRAGTNVVELAMKSLEADGMPEWHTVKGLMMNAIYGGRIANPYDIRVLEVRTHPPFSPARPSRPPARQPAGTRSLTHALAPQHGALPTPHRTRSSPPTQPNHRNPGLPAAVLEQQPAQPRKVRRADAAARREPRCLPRDDRGAAGPGHALALRAAGQHRAQRAARQLGRRAARPAAGAACACSPGVVARPARPACRAVTLSVSLRWHAPHARSAVLVARSPPTNHPHPPTHPATPTATAAHAHAHPLQLSVQKGAAAKFDRERWRRDLGPMIERWAAMAGDHVLSQPEGEERRDADPLEAFVVMEDDAAWRTVRAVDAELGMLKKVLYGSGLLTPAIQATASALLAAEVPRQWEARWEGPENPSVWLRELLRRKRALVGWRARALRGSLLDDELDLSELFSPGTFLNALRQQTARTLRCSMDALKLVSSWSSKGLKGAALSIRVGQLLIQGAAFDGKVLREAEANATELEKLQVRTRRRRAVPTAPPFPHPTARPDDGQQRSRSWPTDDSLTHPRPPPRVFARTAGQRVARLRRQGRSRPVPQGRGARRAAVLLDSAAAGARRGGPSHSSGGGGLVDPGGRRPIPDRVRHHSVCVVLPRLLVIFDL